MSGDIQVGTRERAAAILTAAYTVQSVEIETNKQIARIWKDFHDAVKVEDDFGLLASVLVSGRLMDMKAPPPTAPRLVSDAVNSIRTDILQIMVREIFGTDRSPIKGFTETYCLTNRDMAASLLTASFVRMTPRIETLKETVRFWNNLRHRLKVRSHEEFLAAVLLSGRVAECGTEQGIVDQMTSSVEKVMELLVKRDIKVKYPTESMAVAMLVSAYITHTPGLETYSQIADLFQRVHSVVVVKDDLDVISLLLVCGKIQDANHTVEVDRLNDTIQILKTNLKRLSRTTDA